MRLLFKKCEQKEFMKRVCIKLNKTLLQISKDYEDNLKISYSSMKRYYREEITLPLQVAKFLSKMSNVQWQKYNPEQISENWGSKEGGKKGIKTLFRKYKKELKIWRKKGGSKSKGLLHAKLTNKKTIKLPSINEKLAEFVGICLGDGTLTKYFVRISGDKRFDVKYFAYISHLCEALFKIKPSIRPDKKRNAYYLTVFSIDLCSFLHDLGLPYGDKILNKATIPGIFCSNKKLLSATFRGLIDTDGGLCKSHDTIVLTFTSHNKQLLAQIWHLNEKFNIFSSKDDYHLSTSVWKNILKYFNLVGSSNIKNIIRFIKRNEEDLLLYHYEVLKYYKQYRNIQLPYKFGSVV